MPKEELELLSYTKIAELYLKETKKTKNTAELFKEICTLLNLSEAEYQAKIADFFQSLTTSKEFILLEDGTWDLKSNHVVKIKIDDLYEEKEDIDEETDESEEELSEEDDNYNISDDDYIEEEEDLSDLTIVDEEEMDEE